MRYPSFTCLTVLVFVFCLRAQVTAQFAVDAFRPVITPIMDPFEPVFAFDPPIVVDPVLPLDPPIVVDPPILFDPLPGPIVIDPLPVPPTLRLPEFTFTPAVQLPKLVLENGDVNGDGSRDMTDAIGILKWLFLGGEEPASPYSSGPAPRDEDDDYQNGDFDMDGQRDFSDAISMLKWMFLGYRSPINFETCDNIVEPELRKRLPRAVTHNGTDVITLWGVGKDGLVQKRFRNGRWENRWQHFGNDGGEWEVLPNGDQIPDVNKTLPMTSGFDNNEPEIYGAIAFPEDAPGRVGVPYAEGAFPPSRYQWEERNPRADGHLYFYPSTAVGGRKSQQVGSDRALFQDVKNPHFFGIADDNGHPSDFLTVDLVRMEVARNSFSDPLPSCSGHDIRLHTHPVSGFDREARFALPGPNSACSIERNNFVNHFCFVNVGYRSGGNTVTYLHYDGNRWQWGPDLGNPVPGSSILGTPLAVAFKNGEQDADRWNIHVFVVAVEGDNQGTRYKLYERVFRDNGAGFDSTPWIHRGRPVLTNGRTIPDNQKFYLTSGVVWRNYHAGPGVYHLNIFGWARGFWDGSNRVTGNLITFYNPDVNRVNSNGVPTLSGWGFSATPPDGEDYRTESSTAFASQNDTRISVFGRSASGKIWETYYPINENGYSEGWKWSNLSCEPSLRRVDRPAVINVDLSFPTNTDPCN